MPTLDQYPRRDGLYRILPHGVAVHNRYQDRVIMLDSLSGEIWLRADGQTTLREIARDIAGLSGTSTNAMYRTVAILIVILNSEGVLYPSKHPAELPYHLRLPQEDQDLDQMHNSLIAAGWIDEW
jgi:hypothetical protein